MNIKSLTEKTKILNKHLLFNLVGKPVDLYDAASHIIANGGKRIRPYLVLKCCEMLDGKNSYSIRAASAIEMIHNFTLVHDDIIDNDNVRHGVTTVHKKFGMPIAILAGDVLFSKAYHILSNYFPHDISTKLISILAKSCIDLCEGQSLDIKMAQNKNIPTQKEYIKMIEKKTAALFDASCTMGVICANAKQKDIKNFSMFGKNLGIAFQMIDDLIGISGDSKITKKPVGNDLREGKKSLPIIIAIKKSKNKQYSEIMNVFGNIYASKGDIENVISIIHSMKIDKIIRRKAMYYSEKSRGIINEYQNSVKKDLIEILDFIVERAS